ncbi:MAG: retroviral-like aspartic protease family protein [Endomicrobium sp.]|nr:retroviral-like aspartic protease family protein [Endomicrobium sp.]
MKALFDTGATSSCITTALAKQLELNPLSKIVLNTANGPKDCNVYKLKIAFPFPTNKKNKIRLESPNEIEVSEINDNPIWKIIIGMDIIQQGILVVSNGNYIFSL